MLKVILLPGMDGTGMLFADLIAELSGICETIVISYPSDRHLDTPELVDLIRSRCPVVDPYILLAESFSVSVAIYYAASKPFNLKGLILCAGFVVSPVHGWKRFLGSLLAPIIFRIKLPKFAAIVWLIGPSASSSLLLAVRKALASVKPQVLVARLRFMLACEARPELARVDVPILYFQAKRDNLVKPICLEFIQLIKPQVEVVTVEGPHLMLQRDPQRFVETIVRFARSAILRTR